jgi:hypothetical protein
VNTYLLTDLGPIDKAILNILATRWTQKTTLILSAAKWTIPKLNAAKCDM